MGLPRERLEIEAVFLNVQERVCFVLDHSDLSYSLEFLASKNVFSARDVEDIYWWKDTKKLSKDDLLKKFLAKLKRVDPGKKPVESFAISIEAEQLQLARHITYTQLIMQYSCCSISKPLYVEQVRMSLLKFAGKCFNIHHNLKKGDENPFMQLVQSSKRLDEKSIAEHYLLRFEKESGNLEGIFLQKFKTHMEMETECDYPQLILMKDLSLKAWAMFEKKDFKMAVKLFENARQNMLGLAKCQETCLFLIDLSNFYMCLGDKENIIKAEKCLEEAKDHAAEALETGQFEQGYEALLYLNLVKKYLDFEPDKVYLGTWGPKELGKYDPKKAKIAKEHLAPLEEDLSVFQDKYKLSFCIFMAICCYQNGDLEEAILWGCTKAQIYLATRPPASVKAVENIKDFGEALKELSQAQPLQKKKITLLQSKVDIGRIHDPRLKAREKQKSSHILKKVYICLFIFIVFALSVIVYLFLMRNSKFPWYLGNKDNQTNEANDHMVAAIDAQLLEQGNQAYLNVNSVESHPDQGPDQLYNDTRYIPYH